MKRTKTKPSLNKGKGLLLDSTYTEVDEKSVVKLFVKEEKATKGSWFFVDGFKPYFYVLCSEKEIDKTIKELVGFDFGETERFKIAGAKKTGMLHNNKCVLKVEFEKVSHVIQARKHLRDLGFERFEYDIPFGKRYLIDSALEPGNWIEFETSGEKLKSIEKIDGDFNANIVAFDLETWAGKQFEIGGGEIMMASIVDSKKGKVISHHTKKVKGLKLVDNEEELIGEIEKGLDGADLIVTYNGDNFDFPYLNARAKKLKTTFEINGEKPRSMRRGMDNASKLSGVQHIDAYQMMRFLQRTGSVNLVKLDIENVSEKIFGIKKEKVTPQEGNEAWETGKGLARFVDYNLKDSEVALKIVEDYLPLFIEISKLTSQTLFNTTRNSTSTMVEDLLMKEAHKRKVVAPNRPKEPEIRERESNPMKGAFVKEPIPGLHEDIAVVDFASLYPSIIISHNISPETLNCKHKECKKNISPDGTWFCKKEKGLFPEILEEMLSKRLKFKREYKEKKTNGNHDGALFAKQWALKIIMNSAFGYMGYPRARWYSRESASAILSWAREYIQNTIKQAEKEGFEVIYGDSITNDRCITIKNLNGLIEVKPVEKFYEEIDTLRRERGTKQIKPVEGYFALSVNQKTKKTEWAKINEIIRHKTKKPIFRVNQKFGETIVTEDHSILTETKTGFKETKAKDMKKNNFFKAINMPKTKNLPKIDLFEFLKSYTYIRRHKDKTKISQWHIDKDYIWFGFYNIKKQIKLKRNIKINSKEFESLCRLLGAYVAEGSSSTVKTSKSKNGASLASSDVIWLKELEKDYHILFKNAKTCIIPSTKKPRTIKYKNKEINYIDKTHKLQMMNETSAEFFKGLCGQKSNGKKLPTFIFNVPNKFKKILLEKAIEGDGSHSVNKKLGYSKNYIKNNFQYTTNSLQLISGISLLLNQLNQNYSIQYRPAKKAYSIKTSAKHNSKVITKISEENYSGFVYDLNVEKNNNFVDSCGQILLHNTDSNFLKMNGKKEKDIEKFLKDVNDSLPGEMELELDGLYKRGIFVTKKEGGAAKKRYALIDKKGNLKIVGFEYVRRDWCNVAKETQKKVIELVLSKGDPEEAAKYVRGVITNLKNGKVKKEDLTIVTVLKRKIEQYSSIGPHVAAAKKAMNRGVSVPVGTVLSYIVTGNGGKSISDKAELEEFVKEGDYDPDYYIENQVLPAVFRIMQELDYSKEDLVHGGKQTGLDAWS